MKSLPLLPGVSAALLLAAALPSAAFAQTFEDQVMEIVNQERWTNGQLAPLKRNAQLDASSETHSSNMAVRNFFQHCDPDNGSLPWDRMTAAGYTGWNYAAENIAAGYSTPQAVMTGWMNSSGHRANILSTSSRELGIGHVYQSGDQNNVRADQNGDCTSDSFNNGPFGHYWTQNFGRKATVYPLVVNREAYQTINAAVSLYVYGAGWAVDMRFRNESGAWSAWEPYSANRSWTLSAGNGTKTVTVEIRNGATTYSSSDTIVLNASADLAVVLSDDVDPCTVGASVTYHAAVTNSGGSAATGVTLTQTLPSGMTFVSCSMPHSLNAGVLTVTVGAVAAGGNAGVDIVLSAGTPGSKVLTSVVAANEPDPATGNNTGQESTTVEAGSVGVPEGPDARILAMHPGRPNPFLGATRLSWSQAEAGAVRLAIFDAAGRLVTILVEETRNAGEHVADWNGTDASGQDVRAGIYFARLDASGSARTIKLIRSR